MELGTESAQRERELQVHIYFPVTLGNHGRLAANPTEGSKVWVLLLCDTKLLFKVKGSKLWVATRLGSTLSFGLPDKGVECVVLLISFEKKIGGLTQVKMLPM